MSASITSGTYPRASVRNTPATPATPATTATPGGLAHAAAAVWRFLVRLGASRAQPELMRLSRRHALRNPALSRQLREAASHLLHS